MNSSTLSSLLFTLSLFLILHAPMPALCDNLYEIVCNEAKEDASSCLGLLNGDTKITLAKNYLDLCNSILGLAIDKGTDGQNYITKVTNENPTQAIRQCATEFYGGAIASLRSSMGELTKNPQSAYNYAKAAGDGFVSCEDALIAEKTNNPTIHSLNKEMVLLSEIALLATKHLVIIN